MSSVAPKKARGFKTFSYRGVDLAQLVELSTEDFVKLTHARVRRRFARGLNEKPAGLIKKLNAAKLNAVENEKPAVVKTHLRNMVILPEMIGAVVGIYNGKTFNQVELKPEMVGHYLGEFSITYTPVRHGGKGKGGSRLLPF